VRAADRLADLKDPRTVEPLVAKLEDWEPRVRKAAAEVLGRIGDARTVEPLVAALADKDEGVRDAAAEALHLIDRSWEELEAARRAVPRLLAALIDEDSEVCYAAAEALDRIDPNWASEAAKRGDSSLFMAGLAHNDADVRREAAEALDRIDTNWAKSEPAQRVLSTLVAALSGVEAGARAAAENALDRSDPNWRESEAAKRSVPALVAALEDLDPYTRTAAVSALKAMRWQPADERERRLYERASGAVSKESIAADTRYPIITEIDSALSAIRNALATGKSIPREPLRSRGISIMKFSTGHESNYRHHIDLLTRLADKGLLARYELWRLDLGGADDLCGLIVVCGSTDDMTDYARKTYYLPAAEAFVAEKCGGDWQRIDAASSISDTPDTGMGINLSGAEHDLAELRAIVLDRASSFTRIESARALVSTGDSPALRLAEDATLEHTSYLALFVFDSSAISAKISPSYGSFAETELLKALAAATVHTGGWSALGGGLLGCHGDLLERSFLGEVPSLKVLSNWMANGDHGIDVSGLDPLVASKLRSGESIGFSPYAVGLAKIPAKVTHAADHYLRSNTLGYTGLITLNSDHDITRLDSQLALPQHLSLHGTLCKGWAATAEVLTEIGLQAGHEGASSPGSSVIVAELLSPDSQTRREVARRIVSDPAALSMTAESEDVERLMAALTHEEYQVREAAATALGDIGDARAVGPLAAALGDSESVVQSAAHFSLIRFGLLAVDPLLDVLNDVNADGRAFAAGLLGLPGNVRAVQPLIATLKDAEQWVRRHAAESLGLIGDPEAVDAIVPLLHDENRLVRETAAEALGRIKDKRAVEPLLTMHLYGGSAVAWALGELGDTRAIEHLSLALRDFDLSEAAKEALEKIGGPEAEQVLAEFHASRQ
jgi:HEAT repeat protein